MPTRSQRAGLAACLLVLFGGSAAAGAAAKPVSPAPTDDPSHGGNDAQWRVIAPALLPEHGPPARHQPRCQADQVTATARTRPIPGGVAGIVHLKGQHCSIHSHAGPDELRRGGATLAVDRVPLNQQSPRPEVQRSDIPLAAGKVIWSFMWTGSWCGDKPTSVVIPLAKSHGDVVAPLTGPTPGCQARPNTTPSVLTAGPPGWPHGADLAAPSDWSGLTASLHAPKVLHGSALPNLSVTFSNTTATDIPLAPCPSYALTVLSRHGGGTAKGYGSAFPCRRQPRVVPADGAVTVRLPDSTFPSQFAAPHGGRVRITFAILGVPSAVTHARVAKE
jgi:hypothetical protein